MPNVLVCENDLREADVSSMIAAIVTVVLIVEYTGLSFKCYCIFCSGMGNSRPAFLTEGL